MLFHASGAVEILYMNQVSSHTVVGDQNTIFSGRIDFNAWVVNARQVWEGIYRSVFFISWCGISVLPNGCIAAHANTIKVILSDVICTQLATLVQYLRGLCANVVSFLCLPRLQPLTFEGCMGNLHVQAIVYCMVFVLGFVAGRKSLQPLHLIQTYIQMVCKPFIWDCSFFS